MARPLINIIDKTAQVSYSPQPNADVYVLQWIPILKNVSKKFMFSGIKLLGSRREFYKEYGEYKILL